MEYKSDVSLFTNDFVECVSTRCESAEENKVNCLGNFSFQGLSPGIIILENSFRELLAQILPPFKKFNCIKHAYTAESVHGIQSEKIHWLIYWKIHFLFKTDKLQIV